MPAHAGRRAPRGERDGVGCARLSFLSVSTIAEPIRLPHGDNRNAPEKQGGSGSAPFVEGGAAQGDDGEARHRRGSGADC